MDETYELKKALLQSRLAAHQNGFALAELQLKVLEDEHKAELAEVKPVSAENDASLPVEGQ